MLFMTPPPNNVVNSVGFLKEKSAMGIFRCCLQVKYFLVRGCGVSTVDLGEELIRKYIKIQELKEMHQEQMRLAVV